MTISDEIQKLEELRRNGLLSPKEFEIAKRRVIEGPLGDDEVYPFEEIKVQNEIAQLDRGWALERENYMVMGQHGHKYPPRVEACSGDYVLSVLVSFGLR